MKGIKILHEGEDYFKLNYNGIEVEVDKFEGLIIKDLIEALQPFCEFSHNQADAKIKMAPSEISSDAQKVWVYFKDVKRVKELLGELP